MGTSFDSADRVSGLERIALESDGTVRVSPLDSSMPVISYSYGKNGTKLLHFEKTAEGGFVADYRPAGGHRIIECVDANAKKIWMATPYGDDLVRVSPDRFSFSINDAASVTCPEALRYILCLTEQVFIMTDDDPDLMGRNIFAYDRTGRMMWQVESQDYRPGRAYAGLGISNNDELFAEATGFRAYIDKTSGKLLKIEGGKF